MNYKSNYKKEKEAMKRFYTLCIIAGIVSLTIILVSINKII